MDAVQQANSGHPGMPMGMADVATVLFSKFLKFDPADPHWPDRDRFILSAGHGSMLLYSLLYLTGYADMTMEEIKRFRQLGSKTAGHPEHGHASGIETTTGPLGQGVANSVGFALAERHLRARFGADVVDHFTYCICGDGCLMEGIGQEAVTLAGHLGLGRLILLYDNNSITIDGPTSLSTMDDHKKRFLAAGWHVQEVDGLDQEAVTRAIRRARNVADKPSMISCKTIIGYGAPTKEGTAATHGSPLGKDEVAGAREKLGWTAPAFEIPEPIFTAWRKIGSKGKSQRRKWMKRHAEMAEGDRAEFDRGQKGDIPPAVDEAVRAFKQKMESEKPSWATRKSSQEVLEVINPVLPETIGGSADLTPSNNTKTKTLEHADRGRAGRALHALRHPRARDVGGDERPRAAWRRHPLRRHLPGVHRLRPRRDPPLGADGRAGDLRDDARFDRPGRGRPDPSGGRAPRRPCAPSPTCTCCGRPMRSRRRSAGSSRSRPAPARPYHDLVERVHRLFHRRVGIEAIDQVDVDIVGLQALELLVDRRHQVLAAGALVVLRRAHADADLGRQHDVLALHHLHERGAHDLLGAAGIVGVGGVEEGDADIEARA